MPPLIFFAEKRYPQTESNIRHIQAILTALSAMAANIRR